MRNYMWYHVLSSVASYLMAIATKVNLRGIGRF